MKKLKMIFEIPGENPLKSIGITEEDGALTSIDINPPTEAESSSSPLLTEAKRQLLEYLDGKRKCFELPFRLESGSAFQQKVWAELMKIPYGEVVTYKELAARAGCPGGARAVGQANSRNPLPIIIPCHRVVAVSGIGGYGGSAESGIRVKKYLLEKEGYGRTYL